MRNLWTFGCSYTYGDGTLEHDLYRQKFKVNENDLPWSPTSGSVTPEPTGERAPA